MKKIEEIIEVLGDSDLYTSYCNNELTTSNNCKAYLEEISKFPLLSSKEEVYYGNMLQNANQKKLLIQTEIKSFVISKLNIPLLFRSLSNNSSYQLIIEGLLALYTKLNSNCDEEAGIIKKYQTESKRLNRPLNDVELQNIFSINVSDNIELIDEKDLLNEVKSYINYKYAFDKMFVSNLKFVVYIINSLGLYYDYDLINVGNMGLLKAIPRYDISKGFRFSTYASGWIKESLLRYIGKEKYAYKLSADMIYKVQCFKKAVSELENKEQRALSNEEIANRLSMTLEDVDEYQKILNRPVSLDEDYGEDREITIKDFIPSNDNIEDIVMRESLSDDVEMLLSVLREREKEVIKMRFGIGEYEKPYTVVEIAKLYSCSHQRIYQIEKTALSKMRRAIRYNKNVQYLKEYVR